MNYYVIRPSSDVKTIGHYPQVKEVKQNCHIWDEPKFIEHINFEKINFQPITANAILYSKSRVTDLIAVTGMGFTKKLLISGKLKDIFQKNIKQGIQFFQSGIYHKNAFIEDYWVTNAFDINMESVDFEKSEFVFRKRKTEGGTYLEKVNINSIEDFKKTLLLKKELSFTQFYIDRIKLKENLKDNFLTLTNVEGGVKYVVSEILKMEIENADCTGIEFMPVEMKLSEWLQGGEKENINGET